MEPESSFPCWQHHITGYYTQIVVSCFHPIPLRTILTLSLHLWTGLPSSAYIQVWKLDFCMYAFLMVSFDDVGIVWPLMCFIIYINRLCHSSGCQSLAYDDSNSSMIPGGPHGICSWQSSTEEGFLQVLPFLNPPTAPHPLTILPLTPL